MVSTFKFLFVVLILYKRTVATNTFETVRLFNQLYSYKLNKLVEEAIVLLTKTNEY